MNIVEQRKFYKNIGERILEARRKANYKQEGLGKSVNLSRVSIVNIEKGRQHPSIHLLWNIAKVLKVEITDLLPTDGFGEKVNVDLKKLVDKRAGKKEKGKLIDFITVVSTTNTQ